MSVFLAMAIAVLTGVAITWSRGLPMGFLSMGVPALISLAVVAGLAFRIVKNWGMEVEGVRFRASLLADATSDGLWFYNPVTDETYLSKRLRSQLGLERVLTMEELLAVFGRGNHEDGMRAWGLWGSLVSNGQPFSAEFKLVCPDGENRYYRWNGRSSNKGDSSKGYPIYYGSLACTHEVRQIEEQVNDIAMLAVENPNPVIKIDPAGKILIANKSAETILANWDEGTGACVPQRLLQVLSPILSSHQQAEMEFSCGDRLFAALFVPHLRQKKGRGYINVYCTDVTERAQANKALDDSRRKLQDLNERLRSMAQSDPLTQLPNRALFKDRLKVALETSKRRGDLMAVMMIDLDKFKDINDTYGHDAGDALLIGVAKRLASSVRGSDTVARIGGDEFAIVIQDLQAEENAFTIAEKIIGTFVDPIMHQGAALRTSPSIGIAFHSGRGTMLPDGLYKRADLAMYHAKKSGKNCFKVYMEGMEDDRPDGTTLIKVKALQEVPKVIPTEDGVNVAV